MINELAYYKGPELKIMIILHIMLNNLVVFIHNCGVIFAGWYILLRIEYSELDFNLRFACLFLICILIFLLFSIEIVSRLFLDRFIASVDRLSFV